MRVIAGSAKHIELKTIPGNETRPTTDRIKETLFNMIQFQLVDTRILDLFCGSGALGIEAASRGAVHIVFIDNESRAIQCVKDNLKKTKLEEKAEVYTGDVPTTLKRLDGMSPFDFIFMDPPYEKGLEKQVITILAETSFMNDDTVLIAEALIKTDFSFVYELGLEVYKEKIYKTNKHTFLRRAL